MTSIDAPQTNEPRFQIGARGKDGRYPVAVDGQPTGHIYRWHGNWHAVAPGVTNEPSAADRESAAAQLVKAVDAGRVTAPPSEKTPQSAAAPGAAAPFRTMALTNKRNITSAATALARLAELAWRPLSEELGGGYPGADNPWPMECGICGWQGQRWWSHMRGRNEDKTPRPVNRHDGCIPTKEHAGRLAQLVKTDTACRCSPSHPTTADEAAELLKSLDQARRSGDEVGTRAHLGRLLGPCPAATVRAEALAQLS